MLRAVCTALTVTLAAPAVLANPLPAPPAERPDSWRVVPLPGGEQLNLRKGPGTAQPVIGQLPQEAGGLQRDSCVLLTFDRDEAVAQRPQWCLLSQNGRELGWVAARYLVPEGLVFVRGFRSPTDACKLIGESPGTVDFLDHNASLVGCPEDHRDVRGFLNFGATELARISGYTLLSVPRR